MMKDHISVCICTYRRNQMLERLLRKLALQETDDLFDFSVVVVDNDATGPARETVMLLTEELGLDISYGIEPEQTIPAARNHAIRLSKGNYIAIIDDDEFPPPHWLVTMYRTIKTFDVDGALGPVHPYFEQEPPDWLVKGKFCERPVHRTGTLLKWNQTRTGNCLLKKEIFDKHNILFDEKWKTGGSDRAFFMKAMQTGLRFIACEEAPVYEIVPPERWTKYYYLKRALVNGYNSHRYSINRPHSLSKITTAITSAGAVIAYSLAIPLLALIGTHMVMKYAEKGAHHLSCLATMMGIELVKKRDF
jgi:succinoglycan biosynthesis protein ExoM